MMAGSLSDIPAIGPGDGASRPFEAFPASTLEGSIPDRFEAIAERFADRPAVEDLSRTLTYRELRALVRRIAADVTAAAPDQPGPVAVLARNDALFPAALLGVLSAGRCVAPLDVEHPAERNRLIADHAGAVAVVTTGPVGAQGGGLFGGALPVVDAGAAVDGPTPPRAAHPGPDDLAFLLYTSGSSGVPKGVRHSHRNALNDTRLATEIGRLSAEDRMSMFYSAVIGGIRNILCALLNGASLHVLPPRELGAEGLVREIRRRRITTCLSVPTLFRRIAEAVPPGSRLDSVRLVRLAGDRAEWGDLDLFRRAFAPGARLNVAIGSTECSSTYAHWDVDERLRRDGERLPVGKPMPSLSLRILDEDGRACADGQVGEFVVTGRGLALGYWRDEELTGRAFTPDPDDPDVRTFRTGDMGFRRPDGLLEFVGRKDQMVKLRGHRIEPAEVEAALRACPGVADAAVVVRRWPDSRPRSLAAYVELRPEVRGLLPRHLKAMLGKALPRHMVPPSIIVIEALPRLANYKVDRAGLAAFDAERSSRGGGRVADSLVDQVAEAFERVIGVSGATPEDNLLSLGGDSLQAVDVALEIERRLGLAVPADAFEDCQTIRELAAWIQARRASPENAA